MKKSRIAVIAILPLLSVFVMVSLLQPTSCSGGGGRLLGASGESPLKGAEQVGDAVKVQNSFRKVFEINKHRVVYISTEQTVRMQRNPFMDDPLFREFFGAPRQNMPQTRKRTPRNGFILSATLLHLYQPHVVAGMDKVKVNIDSIVYDASVIGSDERTDIALLKINPKEKLEPVFLGDSNTVMVGDWAIAIGNPFGLVRTFTVGVVSAVGRRDLDLMGDSQAHIQTDASINPGNSGGPLMNIYGEVIGINRMIYSQTGGNIGIGFAIPINTAKIILQELKTNKKVKRGYLGVQIVPLTEEYAKELGLKDAQGALVGQVVEGGPGVKGGIQVGDIILSAGGKQVKDYGDLVDVVEKRRSESPLRLRYGETRAGSRFL